MVIFNPENLRTSFDVSIIFRMVQWLSWIFGFMIYFAFWTIYLGSFKWCTVGFSSWVGGVQNSVWVFSYITRFNFFSSKIWKSRRLYHFKMHIYRSKNIFPVSHQKNSNQNDNYIFSYMNSHSLQNDQKTNAP